MACRWRSFTRRARFDDPPPSPRSLRRVPGRAPPALPPPERLRFQAGLASVFSVGKAPVVLGGAGWFLGVRWRDFSASLEGRALFAPSAGVEDISLGYSFAGASGVTCLHYEWALACVRFELGTLFGSSFEGHMNPRHIPSSGVAIRIAGDRTITPALAVRPYLRGHGRNRILSHDLHGAGDPALDFTVAVGINWARAGHIPISAFAGDKVMSTWRSIVVMAGLISVALAVVAATSCGTHDLVYHPDKDAGGCGEGDGGAGGAEEAAAAARDDE